jgi:C4-dicarboxylate transporter, DctQ subunit
MALIKKIGNEFEEYVCVGLFSLMTLLVGLQVFSRFIFNIPLEWTEELSRFIFIWLVYIAIALTAKHNAHLKMEVGQKLLSKVVGKKIYYLSDLCWLAFNIYMIFYGTIMVNGIMNSIQASAVTRINMGVIYSIIPIGFILMSIRIVQNMRKRSLGINVDAENIEGVIIEEHKEMIIKNDKHISNIQMGEGVQK